MKTTHITLFSMICLAALSALSGCAGQPQNLSAEAKEGYAYFKGYGCGTCHRVGGEGGILGPDLTYVGFRKTPEWLDLWLKDPHAWKKNTVMPNFFFKEPQRKALVAYLASLKGDLYKEKAPWHKPELAEEPIKRGEIIFNSVGCAGCHGPAGMGGQPNNNVVGGLIPTLTKVADGYSQEELVEKIAKGSHPAKDKGDQPDPMISMPKWSDVLAPEDIEAVAQYLISLKPAGSGDDW